VSLESLRTGVALLGMAIAVAVVALDSRVVVWIAIGVLGVAVVLRFVIRRARLASKDDAHPSS
jgi:hypothetical protein